MDSEEFDHSLAGTLSALRRQRGPCPEPDRVLAYQQKDLAEPEMRPVEAHLTLCGSCQELVDRLRQAPAAVDDFTWKRMERALDARPAPWRQSQPWLWRRHAGIAAAVLLLAAPAVWLLTQRGEQRPPEPAVTRGSSIQLREPAGQVERVDEFRWSALPAHSSFRVEIRQAEKLIGEATTPDPRYRPTEELKRRLQGEAVFRWKVQGLDERGQVLEESDWITFEVVR